MKNKKETGQRRWIDQFTKTEQFTIVNTYTIYSPSYKNLIQSIVEVAAFCWWEKRGFICCSLITKYIPTSRILDENVKKYLVSISELWSKWTMLLMKTFDGHLHGKPKRRNWALGNKQTKKNTPPLPNYLSYEHFLGCLTPPSKKLGSSPQPWFL